MCTSSHGLAFSVALLTILGFALISRSAATQTCSISYQLDTASSDQYSLVGISDQIANETSVSVTGFLLPYNGSTVSQSTSHFKGVIYVRLLETSTTTYTYYSVTEVQVSGNTSETYTTPAPYPQGTHPITVAGTITGYVVCVRPVPEFGENMAMIIGIGISAGLLTLLLLTRRARARD